MFNGEYKYNIDEKGRLFIPSEFKKQLGMEIIVAKGMENCLFIYSKEEWEKIVDKVSALGFTQKSAREFSRLFLSGAFTKEFDSQGRIKIDTLLLEHANLKKECTIIGAGSRIEVWDRANWDKYYSEGLSTLEEISESIKLVD